MNEEETMTGKRAACITQFARRVYAEGGRGGCPKERKRELWRLASGRKKASDKATDKSVERAERTSLYNKEMLSLEAMDSKTRMTESDMREAAAAPYVWSRQEWIARVQRIAEGADKEADSLRALDILGKAQGYYAAEKREVDVSMNLEAIMDVVAEHQTPLVVGASSAGGNLDSCPVAGGATRA